MEGTMELEQMRIGTMHTKLIRKEICTSNASGRNDTPQNMRTDDALRENISKDSHWNWQYLGDTN